MFFLFNYSPQRANEYSYDVVFLFFLMYTYSYKIGGGIHENFSHSRLAFRKNSTRCIDDEETSNLCLNSLSKKLRKEKPDVIIIAGDLYDRSVPPTDAIQLLNKTLKEILVDEKTPILAIAGNHDSATRLNFGSEFMKASGLHIVGHLEKNIEPVIMHDEYGEVHFYLVPFAEPSIVRAVFDDQSITSHEAAMAKIIEQIKQTMDYTKRNIIIGHAFITKDGMPEPNTSDSERKLTIGGTDVSVQRCSNRSVIQR